MDTVKSADRVMAILMLLARRVRPVPAATIARECSLPRSSTYQLLNAMRARQFVFYSPETHGWGLGIAAFEIGSAYLRADPLEALSEPVLAQLADATGEVAHIAVLHGDEVLYLVKRVPTHGAVPRLVTEAGVRLPAHLTAVGRAILMGLPRAQVRAIYPVTRPLVHRTDRGPRLHSELDRTLAADLCRGYVVEVGCVTSGVTCVAAPVRGHDGRPVAAINVTFGSARHPPSEHHDLAALVASAAARLSSRLGWRAEGDALAGLGA